MGGFDSRQLHGRQGSVDIPASVVKRRGLREGPRPPPALAGHGPQFGPGGRSCPATPIGRGTALRPPVVSVRIRGWAPRRSDPIWQRWSAQHGQVGGSSPPCGTGVRIAPACWARSAHQSQCVRGGIGIRARLRAWWSARIVRVQVPPCAQTATPDLAPYDSRIAEGCIDSTQKPPFSPSYPLSLLTTRKGKRTMGVRVLPRARRSPGCGAMEALRLWEPAAGGSSPPIQTNPAQAGLRGPWSPCSR